MGLGTLSTITALLALSPAQDGAPATMAFLNGRWFDGTKFVERTLYSIDGVFTAERPGQVDTTLDLEGGFVVPPFAEAHNHDVEGDPQAVIPRYLAAGVFYVKNPNSLPRSTVELRKVLNRPESLDAVFSRGGLTCTGGHPVELVERNVGRGFWTEADGEGAFFFTIDDEADLEAKWKTIIEGRPDFIKTYLLYSEEYEERRESEEHYGWRGLDPQLLPEVVRLAHAEGLRVSTHVETAADFHQAVAAGVDEVNHMPGFRPDEDHGVDTYRIAEEDARLAGEHGVFVVTTLGETLDFLASVPFESPKREAADGLLEMQVFNFDVLRKHGVRIAFGSDKYRGSVVDEVMSIHALGTFEQIGRAHV